MKIAFFGSPRFAKIIIEELIKNNLAPVVVVTNPDRVVGKKKILTEPVAKALAVKHKITVLQPEILDEDFIKTLQSFNLDVILVAAYSKILKLEVLNSAKHKTVGIHPSLLPLYRGATPIQSVLLSGEEKTGTTIYQMDEKMDNGPVIAQEDLAITSDETYLSLEEKLAHLSSRLITENLEKYLSGELKPTPQDKSKATFTKKIVTTDAQVDYLIDDPVIIYRKIQALTPEPGVYTFNYPKKEGRRVKILKAKLVDNKLYPLVIQEAGKKQIELK
ncbi:MAG: methionyl-tRNA formyltransferase [Candidatus Harrisonbacteria bacterium CG10_big_fil_rev_8_21_14_0_10_38_8]|uniref:methionyl-tRNA formyltransferase n=1 Tax=Candidatus Harrisonbacteria bacterium CG10_big_fil_rev_8_21_14_0_10_38_8 TaxID=1974582 RepID=A0A2M6WKC7_9BACT|nr:MAG: methionyl-tRNA formyltransferase [Candidatus Harrisonbacteria bacterium CG10_big_fil_rev_8_21_14_0_10_38_8]